MAGLENVGDGVNIAVIGGGWAGIAAAVELTAQGQAVTLFEAGRVLGGRARSITLDGHRLDNGQHILLGAYKEILALMRQIGADPDQLLQRLPLAIQDNTGFRLQLPNIPAPLHLAWGLFTARGVSLREKLATAFWIEGLKSRKFRLSADGAVAAWLDAAGQNGALRRHLWAPLCLAALNTPIERASAQLFANTLRDSLGSPRREDTDLLLPKADLGQILPEPAAQWLQANGAELRLRHRVKEIGDRPRFYESQNRGLSPISVDSEPFDAAILATAPQHAPTLLGVEVNFGFEFEPIGTVYLAYPEGTTLPSPMLSQQGGIGQWAIDRGHGMIACILSGHGAWEEHSDEELAALLSAELGLSHKPLWHGVVREKRATFACRPNLNRPGPATAHPRLWLAGDYTWADYPGTLEGAVRSGRRAAQLVLKGL